MKPTVFAFFLCLLSTISIAQQIKVTLSDEFPGYGSWYNMVQTGDKFIKYNEIGSKDHLHYGFGWNKVRLALEIMQYDSTMKELKRMSLSGGEKVYGPFFTDLRKIDGKIYIIYHEVQEKNTVGNIMAVRIDPETLQADTPRIIANIAATDYKLKFSESLQHDLKFYLVSSPDKKKSMLLLTTGDKQFFISVLDADMNVLWSKKETLTEDGSVEYKSVCIDNSGKAYIAYKLYNSESESTNTKNRIVVYPASGKPVHFILNMGIATSKYIQLLPSGSSNVIHIGGCYLENSDAQGLGGVFYTTLNPETLKLGKIQQTPFPDSLIHQFAVDGWGNTNKKKYGLAFTMSPFLFEKEDGSAAIIAEFRTRLIGEKGVFDIAGDILYSGFAKGETYFARIPKYRVSAGSIMGSSYHAFPYKDKIVVFYNDTDDNLKKALSAAPDNSNNYKNSVLIAAIIDAKGTVSRQVVVDLQKENYLGLTECIIKISPNQLRLPMQKVKWLGGAANSMRNVTIDLF